MFKKIAANLFVLTGFVLLAVAGWQIGPTWGYAVAGMLALFIGVCIYRSEE